jgi:hypothetical protein
MLGPALMGLVICDAAVLYAARRMGKGSSSEPPRVRTIMGR